MTFVQRNPGCTSMDIAEKFALTVRGSRAALDRLCARELLAGIWAHDGARRYVQYFVVQPMLPGTR